MAGNLKAGKKNYNLKVDLVQILDQKTTLMSVFVFLLLNARSKENSRSKTSLKLSKYPQNLKRGLAKKSTFEKPIKIHDL